MATFEAAVEAKNLAVTTFLLTRNDPAPLMQWLAENLVGFGVAPDEARSWHVRAYSSIPVPVEILEGVDQIPVWRQIQEDVGMGFVVSGWIHVLPGGAGGQEERLLDLGATIEIRELGERGTLGAFVQRNGVTPLLLTCHHVLNADAPEANGDDRVWEVAGGAPVREVGTVTELSTLGQPPNEDWALASITAGLVINPMLPGGLGSLAPNPAPPVANTHVTKPSLSAPASSGIICDPSADVWIDYPLDGRLLLKGMVLIRGSSGPFAGPGDSGSMVVDDSKPRKAVGMVVGKGEPPQGGSANAPVEDLTAAMPLVDFFNRLHLMFIS